MMRTPFIVSVAVAALCARAMPCAANVVISNAATRNMSCSAGACAPTAADAVLNVQDLEAMLASGNAIVTTTGSGVQATNIDIKTRIAWSAGTTLALDAFRSIDLSAKVTVDGIGGVSLKTDDGGSGGEFACNDNGAITFTNTSSALTINGTAYTLVNSVASLASAIAANPSGAFAFAKSYNAKKDGVYSTSPISTMFGGSFNGLGNTISNLSINDPGSNVYVGLFAGTAAGFMVANVRLINESVQVSSGSAGGLVGAADGGLILHSFNTGSVSGYVAVGGLLGKSVATVSGSGSAATVFADGYGGGLIGEALRGPISDSWATGNVSARGWTGGLVGFDYQADIKHSWASGRVSGVEDIGGLVGDDDNASIERSFASGAVSCAGKCGGLVGLQGEDSDAANISQSYATGSVTAWPTTLRGGSIAGGLVGSKQGGEISNSYASGRVNGTYAAGGLVGENLGAYPYPWISGSYATGMVVGTRSVGGLIGDDGISALRHNYWDTTTSGITGRGAGNMASDPGIKGLRNKQLKSGLPNGFDPKIWNEDSKVNGGLPYLIANSPAN